LEKEISKVQSVVTKNSADFEQYSWCLDVVEGKYNKEFLVFRWNRKSNERITESLK
jgi:hypothetical protein